MIQKLCPVCEKIITHKANKYCSRKCYFSIPKTQKFKDNLSNKLKGTKKTEEFKLNLSEKLKGKPKPWAKGSGNPNYQGKYTSDPLVREKHLIGIKNRKNGWTEEHKKNQSKRMKGENNSLYGKKHSQETIEKISKAKKQQYKDGLVKVNLSKISKAEKEIAAYLLSKNISFKTQYHILNVPYSYDFYLPDSNLIIEYQGDYWHANPLKYKSGTLLSIILKGKVLVDDIWARDALKKQSAITAGHNFISIWESEYKLQGLQVIDNLLCS